MPENEKDEFVKAWEEHVRWCRENTNRIRDENDARACSIIRNVRQEYDHMTYVAISVKVPVCGGCRHSESRWLEESHTPTPHIFSDSWKRDYALYGVPRNQIKKAAGAIRSGAWQGPDCFVCGSVIPLDVRGGEGFFVRTISLTEYCGLEDAQGRRPARWMERIILEAYDGKCASCDRQLEAGIGTFDHILPISQGGATELENLQPLCNKCNQEKGNLPVERVEHPPLLFPLLPPSIEEVN